MFSGFRFHFFACVKIDWQLLNLKTVFIWYFVGHTAMLILLTSLLLMIVAKRYLWVALIRGHLGTVYWLLVSHVYGVDVLWMLILLFLALSWMDYSRGLNICFLTGRSASGSYALTIGDGANRLIASRLVVRVWVEVIACSREWRQNALLRVICFERFIDIWEATLRSPYRLYLCNFLGYWLFLLFYVRTITSLWVLLKFTWIAKGIFGSILFLGRQNPLVKKFGVLTSVKCIAL